MLRTPIVFLLAALLLPAVGSTAVVPLGNEATLAQIVDPEVYFTPPTVAARGHGFVVAWTKSFARYPGGSQLVDWGGEVEARRIGSNGRPEGAKLTLVPVAHKLDLSVPALAADSSGRFAVVWSSAPEGHPRIEHWLRQFSANGAVVSTVRLDQFQPGGLSGSEPSALTLGAAGRAFAVWPRPRPTPLQEIGLFGRVFRPSGQPLGPRFRVGTGAVAQQFPRLDTDRAGNAVLVYQTQDSDGRSALFLRHYDPNGRATGGEVRLTPPTPLLGNAALDVHADGRFALAWWQDDRIWARIYAPPHQPVTPAFVVDDASRFVFLPGVALGSDGTVFVTWQAPDLGDNYLHVRGRAFGPSGAPLGEEFRIDRPQDPATGQDYGTHPAVAAGENGTFLVTWLTASLDSGGSALDKVVARLYGVRP